jgi:FkbH-like protein
MLENINFSAELNLADFIKKKNLKKKTNIKFKNLVTIKFIGGYTMNDTYEFLEYFLNENNINCKIEENIWGPAYLSLSNTNILKINNVDFLIITNSWRDLISQYNYSEFNINEEDILQLYKNKISKLVSKNNTILLTEFGTSEFKINSNSKFNFKEKVDYINYNLKNITRQYDNCQFIELYEELKNYGFNKDYLRDWYSFGKIFEIESSIYFSYLLAKKISKKFYSEKKVIIIDLDNTIWGGIIGDEKIEDIKIGNTDSQSRIFLEIQLYLKMLEKNGIILCIVSKNEETIALKFLKNKRNILKIDDFASYRINWEKKSVNIESIQKELNLGMDSFVFLDDNPAERLEVKKNLPEVSVPDIGNDPENFLKILNEYNFFDLDKKITNEDNKRTSQYLKNKERVNYKKNFNSEYDFIKSLKIEITFQKLNDENLERVFQLTNKTNQFNFTTQRLNKKKILNYKKNNKKILIVSAKDIFGEYGIISVVYISFNNFLNIDNWIMSCRVFGKKIEDSIFFEILKEAKKNNKTKINITYLQTAKNKVLQTLIERLEFKKKNCKQEKELYELNVIQNKFENINYCRINYER